MPEKKQDFAVGLIGHGHWGKNLARNFHALGALHTICEADRARHAEIRNLYPTVRVVSDVEELLADGHVSQVAIAAPAVQHYPLAREAILSGRDVFVEKPFCLRAGEGRELKRLAEENSTTLMVGHLLQYHPAICRLQEMVQTGTFGKLYRITSHRLNLGKVRSEENAFWSLAPHDTSVILSLVASARPLSVQSIAETYLQEKISDCSLTSIQFSGGVNAEIQVSWLHPFKEQKLCVIGEKAMAVFDDTEDWRSKLTLRRNYFESPQVEPIPLDPEEPLRRECEHFLDCCKAGAPPKTDAAEGIRVLQILEAAQESADNGGSKINLEA